MEELEYLAAVELEGAAQGGMALDQSRKGLGKSIEVELTLELPEGREVIGGEIGLELVEEPEAGLGVGGREDLAALRPIASEGLGSRKWSMLRGRAQSLQTAEAFCKGSLCFRHEVPAPLRFASSKAWQWERSLGAARASIRGASSATSW
jgi:hypothetical protein